MTAQDLFENSNVFFNQDTNTDFVTGTGKVYSPADQSNILATVQGTWFLTLVVAQAFHIFVCRTSVVSVVTQGLLKNPITIAGTGFALFAACMIVYLKPFQNLLNVGPVPVWIIFAMGSLSFSLLCGWSELRKYLLRTYPDMWVSTYLRW